MRIFLSTMALRGARTRAEGRPAPRHPPRGSRRLLGPRNPRFNPIATTDVPTLESTLDAAPGEAVAAAADFRAARWRGTGRPRTPFSDSMGWAPTLRPRRARKTTEKVSPAPPAFLFLFFPLYSTSRARRGWEMRVLRHFPFPPISPALSRL